MTSLRVQQEAASDLDALCRRWNIRRLSRFAAPNGPALQDRVNLLVEFVPGESPEALGPVEAELSKAFGGNPIHIVTEKSLPPKMRSLVVASAKVQYVAKPRPLPRAVRVIIGASCLAVFVGSLVAYGTWPGRGPLTGLSLALGGAVLCVALMALRETRAGKQRVVSSLLGVTLVAAALAEFAIVFSWLSEMGVLHRHW